MDFAGSFYDKPPYNTKNQTVIGSGTHKLMARGCKHLLLDQSEFPYRNPPDISSLRFETFTKGPVCQIMHIGPLDDEGPTIERLHSSIGKNDHTRHGNHHEIYLSDIRRAAPKNWRTVLRQPIL